MMKTRLIPLLALTALLAGCADGALGNKQTLGTGIGALAGGLLGSQVGSGAGKAVATGLGALAGGAIGGAIGAALNKAEAAALDRETETVLNGQMNKPATWTNPETGTTVSAVALSQTTENGQTCRLIEQKATVNDKTVTAPVKKCKQADGTWKDA